MARPKAPSPRIFTPVREPPRVIMVSSSLTAFCEAVYHLGLDPYLTYRAESQAQVTRMQETWQNLGIPSTVINVEGLAEQEGAEYEATADESSTYLATG